MGTESHCSFSREAISILLGNTQNEGLQVIKAVRGLRAQ